MVSIIDRYEDLCSQWAKKIASLSPNHLHRKLPELHSHGSHLLIRHFDQDVVIHSETGVLTSLDPHRTLSINTKLNIYTLLWYCKADAKLSGQWLPFHSMKNASPFAPAFQKTVLDTFSRTFQGNEQALIRGVTQLHGYPINAHSYFIPAFACMPLRIQFWDGDEDFPAQGNILFDQNATDFIHVESLVTIASECIHRLSSFISANKTPNS